MNDENEMWKEYRGEQRDRRTERVIDRTSQILSLKEEGFDIEQKSAFHVRVNGRLDLWPTHNRFHDIRRNKRGGYGDVIQFVKKFFKGEGGE